MNLFKKFKEAREKEKKAREEEKKIAYKLYDEWIAQDANPEETERSLPVRESIWNPASGVYVFMHFSKEHLNDKDKLNELEKFYDDFLNKEFKTKQGKQEQAAIRIEILMLRKKIKKHCINAPRHIVRGTTYFSDLYKLYIQYSL